MAPTGIGAAARSQQQSSSPSSSSAAGSTISCGVATPGAADMHAHSGSGPHNPYRRRCWAPRGLLSPCALLLQAQVLLLAWAAVGVHGTAHDAPKAIQVIPDDLGPVQAVQGVPSATTQYTDLALMYEDYRSVKMRPLLHLEPLGMAAPSPQLMIFAAFLDTRPLYYKKAAVLRVMTLKYEPDGDVAEPHVYCKWLVEGKDRYFMSKAHGPLRVNTNRPRSLYPYLDVVYTCQTDIVSVEQIEAAAASNTSLPLPRFVTLVTSADQEVAYRLAWVHVTTIPLVHDRAAEVNKVMRSAREPKDGPYVTRQQYIAGEGALGVCVGPMYAGDHAAAIIGEWAEFQKLMGVTKVFLYDFQAGTLTRHFLNTYAAEGLFEVYDWLLSKRLLIPDAESKPDFCNVRHRFDSEVKRDGLMSSEWMSGCASKRFMRVNFHAQDAQRQHCIHTAMGRYRWVAVIDLDEYLTPRLNPPVGWVQLFKEAIKDAPTGFQKFGYQYNETASPFRNTYNASEFPFPGSFLFSNTYVCHRCVGHYHLTSANASVDRRKVITVVPPRPDLDPEMRTPRPSLHAVVWASVRAEVMRPETQCKSVTDPLAVMTHYAHLPWTSWYMEGGSLPIPTSQPFLLSEDVALIYHVRVTTVNNIHILKQSLGQPRRSQLAHLDQCEDQMACASPTMWKYNNLFEDWTLANLYGEKLVEGVQRKFQRSTMHGAFA